MALDIRSKYAVDETAECALRDANDEPMVGDDNQPLVITLYGPGSRHYAKAQAAQQNRLIDKLKRKGKADETAEEKAREQADFLCGCTKSFSPNIGLGDDKLKGEALYRAVYMDRSIGFIAEQVAKFLQDWSSFKKPSTTS